MRRRRSSYKKCACCLNIYLDTCFRQRGKGRDKLCLQCTKLPPLLRQGRLEQAAMEREIVLYPLTPDQGVVEVHHVAS